MAGQDPGFPPRLLQAADESHLDWLIGSGFLPDKVLGQFAGRYEMAPGNVLTVRKSKPGLELASSDGVFLPLDPLGAGHFYFRALSADIRFDTGPSGVTAFVGRERRRSGGAEGVAEAK